MCEKLNQSGKVKYNFFYPAGMAVKKGLIPIKVDRRSGVHTNKIYLIS